MKSKGKGVEKIHARSTFGDLPVTPQSDIVLPVSYYLSLTVQLLVIDEMNPKCV